MSDKKDLFSYLDLYTAGSDLIALSMGAPGASTIHGCSELIGKATEISLVGKIALSVGRPSPEGLRKCPDMIKYATKILLNDKEEEQFTFQYGPCKGDPGFREELAKFLYQQYGDKVSSEDVMVTAGATQGLHLISTVMFDKDTPVFIEDPTYFIALNLLKQDLGMNTIPVPTDDKGIDLTILEKMLQKHKPKTMEGLKSPFWGFVYTIPTFNNPKGYCMSPERCRALVQLARKYDIMLLAEDVYNMLQYTDQQHAPPRLLSYDYKSDKDYAGHVLSNCTFSKILAPGLRLGWIEAPPRIMSCLEKCNTAWSGGAFNHYTSKLIAMAMREGMLTRHLVELCKNYKQRMDIACDELTKNLPDGIAFNKPQGGFFIWLELPETINASNLLRLAVEKHNVNFIFGSSTSPTGSCENCVRLSISFCEMNQLATGVQRFCNALKEMMSST